MAITLVLALLGTPKEAGALVDVEGVHGSYDACIAKFTAAGLRNEVDQLDLSKNTFVVEASTIKGWANTIPANKTNASNGAGSGATIDIDFSRTTPFPGDNVAPDGCATLYHEMYHATEDDKGTRNTNDCWWQAPGIPLHDSHLPITEVSATRAENRYRASQGLTQRSMYFSESRGLPVDLPPPSIACENPPAPSPAPSRMSSGGCSVSGGVGCPTGRSFGDPNIVTYNGYSYPFQAVGEFVLTRSTDGFFEVQMRSAPVPGHDNLTLNTAVAVKIGAHRLALYGQARPDADPHNLRFDGKPVAPKSGQVTSLPGGGSILVSGTDAIVQAPSGERVTLHAASMGSFSFINVLVTIGPENRGRYAGVLGDGSGNQNHDLRTRDGKSIAPANAYGNVAQSLGLAGALPQADAAFHAFVNRTFTDSWRVRQEESLFDYAAGTSTTTFTDRSYPRSDFTVASSALQSAASTCRNAGVSGNLLAGCVVDTTGTGSSVFATALSHVQSLLSVPLGSPVDELRLLVPTLPKLPNLPSLPGVPLPRL